MTLEVGANLASVLVILIASIPALIAAYYARKANTTAATTSIKVDGRMTEMLKAKDDLIAAANEAKSYAQGLNTTPVNGVPNGHTD